MNQPTFLLCRVDSRFCTRLFYFRRKRMKKEDVKKGSIYELDGVVPLKEALPLGIQHVLAMFLGNIVSAK